MSWVAKDYIGEWVFLAINTQSPPSYHSRVGIFSSKTINIINLNPMKN